jgi:hypothetical protein
VDCIDNLPTSSVHVVFEHTTRYIVTNHFKDITQNI